MFRPWTHTSDLGSKEACTGLTFVCLSRAKRLVDLMVEPMSFDRIGNLGNSSTMKARLQEEVKLVEFAQSTRVRYADMASSAPSRVTNEVPFSSRCTTKSIARKSPTGSLPPAVPLAITPTFSPWTHTSDDSYMYQLSLVVATATVYILVQSDKTVHRRYALMRACRGCPYY